MRRAGEINEKSCALRLLAATHLVLTYGEHPLELEPALRPLLTFTCSPQRTILAFRRYASKVWLHQLGGLLQLGQLVCAMRVVGGQRVVSVRSSGARGYEHGVRSCDAAACRLSWRLAAHPAAARIRAVRRLYATDQHGWKLASCLLSALGKDQSSAHDGTAIRWSARLAKLA